MSLSIARALIVSALLASLALSVGYFGSGTTEEESSTTSDSWSISEDLPTRQPADLVRISSIFDASSTAQIAQASPEKAGSPGWKVLAILAESPTRFAALIAIGDTANAQTKRLYVDDALPDGSRIVEIGPTSLTIESSDGSGEVRISVF